MSLNLKTAVEASKEVQDFEFQPFPLSGDIPQVVKAPGSGSGWSSKDCASLVASTAVFRLKGMILLFVCLWGGLFAERAALLSSGEVHRGDYFAWGERAELSGTVEGDAYVLGEGVIVDGRIEGDLLVLGGSVDIVGEVVHNVRVLSGQVLVSGKVGNNITALCGNIQLLPSASIGGDVVALAGNVDLSSPIGRDVTVVSSQVRLASLIRGCVQAHVGRLRLTSRAVVNGDLVYRSSAQAVMDPGAKILGSVDYSPSLVHGWVDGTWFQKVLFGSKLIAMLMNFFYSLVVGIIWMRVFPANFSGVVTSLTTHPWKSLYSGVMVLVLLPLVSLILLMTILGVPFALALIAVNIIGFYTAKIGSVFWATQWMLNKMRLRMGPISALFLGLSCYFLLTSIPFVGVAIAFVALLLGLGGSLGLVKK